MRRLLRTFTFAGSPTRQLQRFSRACACAEFEWCDILILRFTLGEAFPLRWEDEGFTLGEVRLTCCCESRRRRIGLFGLVRAAAAHPATGEEVGFYFGFLGLQRGTQVSKAAIRYDQSRLRDRIAYSIRTVRAPAQSSSISRGKILRPSATTCLVLPQITKENQFRETKTR